LLLALRFSLSFGLSAVRSAIALAKAEALAKAGAAAPSERLLPAAVRETGPRHTHRHTLIAKHFNPTDPREEIFSGENKESRGEWTKPQFGNLVSDWAPPMQ